MEHLPEKTFAGCVARCGGNHKVKSFSCTDQFLCMAFAQPTFRESLRDIEACLRSHFRGAPGSCGCPGLCKHQRK
jgi:hypothetical protein